MNLFLKKNFFIETNRAASTSNIQTFQINKLKNKIYTPRLTSAISLDKNTFSPILSSKTKNQILKLKQNTKNNIFSARKKPIKLRKWKINGKIILPQKDFITQKDITKTKDERVESVLSEVINWDNKQLIENNEQFKEAKRYCEKEKKKLNIQKIISENNLTFFNTGIVSDRSEDYQTLSRFAIFNSNYISNLGKFNNKTRDYKSLTNLLDTEKAHKKFENSNLDRLMKIYEYVKSNKFKKKKYKEVIDSTYNLLYQAKKECELSVDLLKERIKALQKYYEAYIESYRKIKTTKDRKINLYEEKIKKYREYTAIYDEISAEIKTYEDNYNYIKSDLLSFINEIEKKLEMITKEINKYKYLFNELKQQQIGYYLEKLKKGEDTRKEGLSWIVQKLMELKVNIEPNLFPWYLDNEQIEYIIKISKLDFELNQLRIILKTFEDKKKHFMNENILRNQNQNTDKNSLKKIKLKKLKKKGENALVSDINFEIDFDSCFNEFIKQKGLQNPKIIELQKKFKIKEGFDAFIKYKTEDNKIKLITKRIRNRMNLYAKTNDSKLFEEIKKHELDFVDAETEYFRDFAQISDRVEELDEIIEKLQKEEYLIFKEKNKLLREKDRKKNFEVVYKALFGNVIFDMESKYKTIFTKIK